MNYLGEPIYSLVPTSGGTVVGPSASTVNALPRFSGTDGTTLKNSSVTLSDGGQMSGISSIANTSGFLTLDADSVVLAGTGLTGQANVTVNDNVILAADNVVELSGFAAPYGVVLNSDTLVSGNLTSTSTVEGAVIKKTGGTSSQYLMADGSSLQFSANSGNSNFYLYKSHANTPTPPPTAGLVYYNNTVQKNATVIYISHKTDDNTDIEVFFSNLSTLNEVYIQQKTLSDNFIKYNITGAPTIVTGSHISIPVAHTSFGGTGETSFGVNEPVLVSFFTNSIETDQRLTALETKTQNQTATFQQTTFEGITVINGTLVPTVGNVWDLGESLLNWATVHTYALKSDIGAVSLDNNRITDLATPTANAHAANKAYVDSAKLFTDLTPTTTPIFVTGRVYYDADTNNLVYAKNDSWARIISSVFTPTPFLQANLKGWFDASNANSISQTPGNVAVWNDLSVNGFNLTGITATPRTGDATINGRNVVNFDGTECIYRTGALVNYYRNTIIVVSTATAGRDMYGSSGAVAGDVLFNVNPTSTYRAHSFRTGDGIRDSTFTFSTGMSIRIQRVGATTLDIIENGNTKKNSFSFGGTDPAVLKGIYLGYRNQSVLGGFIGSMGEVLAFDTDVSDSQLNIIGNYLGSKWGVTWTNLP